MTRRHQDPLIEVRLPNTTRGCTARIPLGHLQETGARLLAVVPQLLEDRDLRAWVTFPVDGGTVTYQLDAEAAERVGEAFVEGGSGYVAGLRVDDQPIGKLDTIARTRPARACLESPAR